MLVVISGLNNPNPTTVYRRPMVIDFTANTWGGIGLRSAAGWGLATACDPAEQKPCSRNVLRDRSA